MADGNKPITNTDVVGNILQNMAIPSTGTSRATNNVSRPTVNMISDSNSNSSKSKDQRKGPKIVVKDVTSSMADMLGKETVGQSSSNSDGFSGEQSIPGAKGRMQKGRLTNPQISLVLGLVSPGIKVGMLKDVLSVDLLILVLKSGPRLCLHKM